MSKTMVIALLLLSIPIFLNLFLRKQIQKQGIPKIKYPYQKKKFLLGIDEKKFFDALSLAIEDESYYIVPNVDLEDFLKVEDVDKRNIYRDKLKHRSVDFLLCDKETLTPKVAINLERPGKNKTSGTRGEVFLDKTFEAADIKFFRFNIKEQYNVEDIKKSLENSKD